MKAFEKFYFKKFSFDLKKLEAKFYYSFDNIEFFEEIIYFKNNILTINNNLIKEKTNICLFNLHLALGISYYKLYPTKKLIIESGFLGKKQIKFWEKFYLFGLGEFFIKNDIDPQKILKFVNNSDKYNNIIIQNSEINNTNKSKSLLLIGGGKDSIVSYNLIKDTDFDLFVFGKLDKIKKNTGKLIGKNILLVDRKISENLFKLNEKGYYNGHVPITGIIAFVTLFFSYLYNYKNIILSNEKSSSEENTIWKGIKINHQYSKSFEFEKDFDFYVKNYINFNINYFSILRGMYEYKIAEIFSIQKKFFNTFSSCNKNYKILKGEKKVSLWCCNCEKCSFVFLILSNFLTVDELIKIFGENIFDKKTLEKTFEKLLGFGKNKPFECVGTYEESLYSFYKSIEKYETKNFYIIEKFKNEVLNYFKNKDLKKVENKLLKIYDENIIPFEFKKLIKNIKHEKK